MAALPVKPEAGAERAWWSAAGSSRLLVPRLATVPVPFRDPPLRAAWLYLIGPAGSYGLVMVCGGEMA